MHTAAPANRSDGAMPAAEDVIVIGAGLAGLVAALHAAEGGASVRVIDSSQSGGRARARTIDPGVVLNGGPRALMRRGPAARELASLGITWHGGRPGTRGSRVLIGGELQLMPGTPLQLLRTRLLSSADTARIGWLLGGLGRRRPAELAGVTVADWIGRQRLGAAGAAFLAALVRLATYVDRPDELDAGAAVAQLQLALGGGVLYLDRGWSVLVDQLVDRALAAGVRIESGCRVESLERAAELPDASWVVRTGSGTWQAGTVVLAVGTPDAATRLSPVALPLGGLGAPATAACRELVVSTPPPVPFLLGIDAPLYLSDHSAAARLAPDGHHVVHLVRYGATGAAADRSALQVLSDHAGIRPADVLTDRFLATMVVSGGTPTAAGGGLAGRPPVQVPDAAGLFLAGDWVGDVGLLADAAVASGVLAGRSAAAAAAAAAAAGRVAVTGVNRRSAVPRSAAGRR